MEVAQHVEHERVVVLHSLLEHRRHDHVRLLGGEPRGELLDHGPVELAGRVLAEEPVPVAAGPAFPHGPDQELAHLGHQLEHALLGLEPVVEVEDRLERDHGVQQGGGAPADVQDLLALVAHERVVGVDPEQGVRLLAVLDVDPADVQVEPREVDPVRSPAHAPDHVLQRREDQLGVVVADHEVDVPLGPLVRHEPPDRLEEPRVRRQDRGHLGEGHVAGNVPRVAVQVGRLEQVERVAVEDQVDRQVVVGRLVVGQHDLGQPLGLGEVVEPAAGAHFNVGQDHQQAIGVGRTVQVRGGHAVPRPARLPARPPFGSLTGISRR